VSLRLVTLGVAACEAQRKVREEGAPNSGPRVMEYLSNAGINVAAPWCAAFVQMCADIAASTLAIKNPLDDVKLEAYVQSYFQWADENNLLVKESQALPGDLVLYSFGKKRWDHIGILLDAPTESAFRTIEGNTNAAGSREGDGVLIRLRGTKKGYPVQFVRWAA
jgi:hypothetical protein